MEAKTMFADTKSAVTRTISQDDYVQDWANYFFQGKKVERVSAYTLIIYKQQLEHFLLL
jgi:hypothetical protein